MGLSLAMDPPERKFSYIGVYIGIDTEGPRLTRFFGLGKNRVT